jgi:hypothetical protein
MRSYATRLGCCAIVTTTLIACGAKPKQVGEYPSENNPSSKPDEEAPKWENAAPREDPKPKPATGVGATEAPTHRQDVYDKEATEVVMKRAARQVKENCGAAKDDAGKASGPWGKATLQIQLGRNGRSKGVTVPAPFQGKPTGNCVEKAFSGLTFPPWGGQDTEITWDVELVNPSDKK